MKNFFILLSCLVLASCSTYKSVAPSEKVIVETRIEKVFETDTVFLEVPRIIEKVVTKDTVSVLENDYARSSAEVSDGLLSHSLETKPTRQPVEIQKEIVYRDSVIIKDNVIVQTVEVEKELTKWQSFKMKTGGFTLSLLVIAIVLLILYIVKHLKLIKL